MADAALDAAVAETQKLLGAQIQKVATILILNYFCISPRLCSACLFYYFNFLKVTFTFDSQN
jgi:hypothetical protein